jgi:hypothetical protein
VAGIDRALVAGEPQRALASRYGISRSAVQRHARRHVPEKLRRAREGREVAEADALADQVRQLLSAATEVLVRARDTDDQRVMLAAVREARGTVETLARLTGVVGGGGTTVHVSAAVEVNLTEVRQVVLGALQPFPDAREAVALALLAHAGAEAGERP